MKTHFLLILLIGWASTTFSQNIFFGSIINEETNEPVVGASVQIKGTYSGTTTDSEGKFTIKSKKETLTLMITHISFEDKEVETVAGQSDLNISLQPKSFLADEVIVSATRANKTASTTFEEISKEEISKQNLAQDIPYLIDQTPSMVTTSDAGAGVGYTYLRMRGSDQTRINVTINGIPYNDPESQQVYWVDLPDFASSVNNVQVQRGVGTSTNGAGAFGGTINIQTTKLQDKPYGELSGSYGSFNTWKATARFGTGIIKNKFTVDGRLSQIQSDGYIDRASSDIKSFFLSVGYYGSKTILRVNVFSGLEETYQAWWGVPEEILDTNRTYNYYNYPNEVDHYRQDHYQIIFSRQAGKLWTINSALHYTRGEGYFEQYKGPEYNNDYGFNTKQSYFDYGLNDIITGRDTITETSLVRRRWLDNHFYGVTFSAVYRKKKTGLTFGGAANRYNGNHFGEITWMEFAGTTPKDYRYYDGDGVKNDANIFAKANYQLWKKLNIFLDLQYRFVQHEIAGTDNDRRFVSLVEHHHFFNPKVGASYAINSSNEIFASFAIGNREPSRSDYVDAPEDRLPQPETLRDLEIGYRLTKPKNLLSITGYYMHYKDQLVIVGLNDVGNFTKRNVDKSYRTGLEISNSVRPIEKFRWDINLSYSMNKINDFTEMLLVHDAIDYGQIVDTVFNSYSNTDISFSPFLVAGTTLSYEPVKHLELAFISKYVSEQFLDNTSREDHMLEGYYVGSFRINYTLKDKLFEEIQFTLLLNNITNRKYESNGYVVSEMYEDELGERSRGDYNYYYPQARFNVMGGVTVRF